MAATPDAEGGSTVAMIRLATSFYAEMLNSPLLTHYFAGVQMDSLIAKQASFIDTIIRGDTGYPAADCSAYTPISTSMTRPSMRCWQSSTGPSVITG